MRYLNWVLLSILILATGVASAASKEVIDAKVREALATFARESPAGMELMAKAAGVLVFPEVIKMGFGVGGTIDTQTMQQPIVGFVFSNRGLMYNLTLEGSKITKIDR